MSDPTSHLPAAFLSGLKDQLGDDYEYFLKSYHEPSPVSVRVNPFKQVDKFNHYEKVSWATNAFYLPERISFTLDPLFHAGSYYVQEASSMYIEAALQSVINPNKSLKVLDLCAAPGGKSTHLLSFLPAQSVLVSNEVIPSRNKILQQNITKWGCANVVVTQNNAADFKRLPGYFDVIVVDAPCSGEGLFRKDPKATAEWSTMAVDRCSARQEEILEDIIPCLKKDGLLIYSTCTFEYEENDNQIEKLLQTGEFEKVNLPAFDGVQNTSHGVQFYPHKIKGEGFYLSMLRKKNAAGGNINFGKPDFSAKYQKLVTDWLSQPESFSIFTKETGMFAIPSFMKQDFTLLMKNLYVRQAGVLLGQLMKNEIVPSHQLALFTGLKNTVPEVELNEEDALRYLRCETISVPGLEVGWKIVTFQKQNLGWIKALGNRINNYYPKESRILMKS